MDIVNISSIPIWGALLVLIIGIFFILSALRSLQSKTSRGPWYLSFLHFEKDKNPVLFWFFLFVWLGIGVALLVFSIFLLISI